MSKQDEVLPQKSSGLGILNWIGLMILFSIVYFFGYVIGGASAIHWTMEKYNQELIEKDIIEYRIDAKTGVKSLVYKEDGSEAFVTKETNE